MKIRLRHGLFAGLLVPALLTSSCRSARRIAVTLSAAASLQNAIVEVETAYRRDHPDVDFRNNFGSSGTLAREIEQGAPVDAFLSAAAKPMDDLEAKGLIVPETRHDFLRNTLVLIAPKDSSLRSFDDLVDKSVRLIALGDPASVPAGQYGKQTLTALHLWDRLGGKLVMGKDVRQVLTYVETGNADAGLVYATDAQQSGKVRVVATAPDASHDPIVYPAAVMAGSQASEAARSFVSYLSSLAAQAVFTKHGFTIATRDAALRPIAAVHIAGHHLRRYRGNVLSGHAGGALDGQCARQSARVDRRCVDASTGVAANRGRILSAHDLRPAQLDRPRARAYRHRGRIFLAGHGDRRHGGRVSADVSHFARRV
jgi:molybdate transport system substrate-binding protein